MGREKEDVRNEVRGEEEGEGGGEEVWQNEEEQQMTNICHTTEELGVHQEVR